MASFNKVILMGNVVRTPEIRYAPGSNNLPIARTALAVNHKYGEKEDVMYIDIVIFGKQAETMEKFVTKGMPLLVEGRLSQSRWEKDGVKNSKHEVIVDSFRFVGRKNERPADENMHNSGSDSFSNSSDMDDDIPF